MTWIEYCLILALMALFVFVLSFPILNKPTHNDEWAKEAIEQWNKEATEDNLPKDEMTERERGWHDVCNFAWMDSWAIDLCIRKLKEKYEKEQNYPDI